MIESFRKLSNNIITRTVIGALIIAFIVWGVGDSLKYLQSNNIVEFKHIKPITLEQFLVKKKENTMFLHQSFDEKKIDMLDHDKEINRITLDQMINNSLSSHLANQYNIIISDKYFLKHIKELEMFKTELGNFNKADFNAAISKIYLSEKDFADSYKEYLLNNLLFNNYRTSIYLPQIFNKENIKFHSEMRIVDIAKIDLTHRSKKSHSLQPTELSLREFHSNNIALFESPERRRIKYVEIKYTDFLKDLVVKPEEVKLYFQEQKEDFYGKNFNESKKEIISILESLARSKALNEFAKSIEDDVASGSSFQEIANKYNLNLITLQPISLNKIKDIPDIIQPFIENIKNMEDNEVSYPMETQDGIVIFEVDKTYPSKIMPFEEIKDDIRQKWVTSMIAEINYQTLAEIAKYTNPDEFHKKSDELGVSLTKNVKVSRNKQANQSLPIELLNNIISLNNVGQTTKVVRDGQYAYLALVKDIQYTKLTKDQIQALNKNMQMMIESSYINGIVSYLKNINLVKINKNFLKDLNHDAQQ